MHDVKLSVTQAACTGPRLLITGFGVNVNGSLMSPAVKDAADVSCLTNSATT